MIDALTEVIPARNRVHLRDGPVHLMRHLLMLTWTRRRGAIARSLVDEFTDETGLVTAEMVPACRVAGADAERGELPLAKATALPHAREATP